MSLSKYTPSVSAPKTGQLSILSFCRQLRVFSLYGVVFSIPLSIAASGICLTLLLLSYLIEIALTRRIAWPQTPINRPLLTFILLTVFLTPFAINVEKSFSKLTNLSDVLAFFLLYMAIRERPQGTKYVGTLLLAMTIGSAYGLLQHYLEIDLFRLTQPISFLKHLNNDLRAPVRISGFSSYMTFGGQLAMIMPVIFAYILHSQERRTRILWGFLFVVNGSALVWTYTRSAWLGSALAIITLGYFVKGKCIWKHMLLTALFAAFVLILQQSLDYSSFAPDTTQATTSGKASTQQENSSAVSEIIAQVYESDFVQRIFSIFQTKDNLERLYTWESSLEMFADHPFTGIGHGNYSKTCQAYRTRYGDFTFTSNAHAHNAVLQVAVNGGIPLLGAFLWLWFALFRSSYQSYRQSRASDWQTRALTLGVFGSLIAFSIHGFFENNFGDSEVLLMLWLLQTLTLTTNKRATRGR